MSTPSPRSSHPATPLSSGVVVLTIVALVAASIGGVALLPAGAPPQPGAPFSISDLTPQLGATFHPGVVLVGGSNGTSSFLGGVGVYHATTDFSLPVLDAVSYGASGVQITNRTGDLGAYFPEGGVYSSVWNGTSWLIAGQATYGTGNQGALISVGPAGVTNISSEIVPYFVGGGIWALGWNGSAWLVGGNSSQGAVLLALDGSRVTNLSSSITVHLPNSWVQLLLWNGHQWLIGGQGLFGTLEGTTFTDLDPGSPFIGTGAFAAVWTGAAWVVGGYAPRLAEVVGGALLATVPLPSPAAHLLVTLVLPLGAVWLVGGRAPGAADAYSPVLFTWDGSSTTGGFTNVSDLLPASFGGGELQGGFPTPPVCPGCYLLIGEGGYHVSTGYGTGAVALLTP